MEEDLEEILDDSLFEETEKEPDLDEFIKLLNSNCDF